MVSRADTAIASARPRRRAGALQALAAMALGLFIVGVVGFAPIAAVHNAAHDVRHSNIFPCH